MEMDHSGTLAKVGGHVKPEPSKSLNFSSFLRSACRFRLGSGPFLAWEVRYYRWSAPFWDMQLENM